MSRKTSKYIRKRTGQGRVENGGVMFKPNAWVARIGYSRGYCGESIVGEMPTSEIANSAIQNAQMALQKLINRAVESSDIEPHDLLAHCIGITQIRVLDMGGEDANGVMQRLNQAARALLRTRQRWDATNEWGLDGPAINDLRDAIDIYEVILRSSSPNLMEHAQNIRLDQVQRLQRQGAPA